MKSHLDCRADTMESVNHTVARPAPAQTSCRGKSCDALMEARKILWSLVVGLSLLALVPLSAGHAAAPLGGAAAPTLAPPSLQGTVTNCTTQATCAYSFSTSSGTGWANSTASATTPLRMAVKLPGEAKGSYNLSYTTYVAKVTNNYPTYTYWTIGSFLGTDVNSGHIIFGATDTNFSATCHVVFKWCHYTYATNNGTIVVHFTKAEATATSFSCSPTTIHPQQKTGCTVTVTNLWNVSNVPTGKVHLSDGGSGLGSFSTKGSCTLTNGTCLTTFRASDNACGGIYLSATYDGTVAYFKSSASTSIDVYVSGGC